MVEFLPWLPGRRALLLLINVVATTLSVLTAFRENAVVALISGRFNAMRSRLVQGRINYRIAFLDHFPPNALPDLLEVASSYKLHSAPTRSPRTLNEDRSTCMRVNSFSASVLSVHFDDYFGKNVRREQFFVWSISAPHCEVVNLKPSWVLNECTSFLSNGNASACSGYILSHFDRLKRDGSVQVGVPVDFGVVGSPFLKCTRRPGDIAFEYLTDLMVMQSFWAGGSSQVEFQTSRCFAYPAASGNGTGLFRVAPADEEAEIIVAVPSPHWIVNFVSMMYGVIYLFSLIKALSQLTSKGRDEVLYIPKRAKEAAFGKLSVFVPDIDWMDLIMPGAYRSEILRFRSRSITAANHWMNNWLFISFSILDACLNIRSAYMLLTLGTWMLGKRVSAENFLFTCSPLTKIAWMACFAHTLYQRITRFILDVLGDIFKGSRANSWLRFLAWYIDSTAMLTSFKVHLMTLIVQLYVTFKVKGIPTISTRAKMMAKRPVYGGFADLVTWWHCEITVDLLVIVVFQLVVTHALVALLLCFGIRLATTNRILQILQRRYLFGGWDVLVAMDGLQIDSLGTRVIDADGRKVLVTWCSLGALIRQLYSSGPSGWVQLTGDDAFSSNDTIDLSSLKAATRPLIEHAVSSSQREESRRIIRVHSRTASVQPHQTSGESLKVNECPSFTEGRASPGLSLLSAYSETTWGSLTLTSARSSDHDKRGLNSSTVPCNTTRAPFGLMREQYSTSCDIQDVLMNLDATTMTALIHGEVLLEIC